MVHTSNIDTFLCIDPHTARFNRLKSAIRDYDIEAKIQGVFSIEGGLSALQEKEYDVIIIAPGYDENTLREFVSQAKASEGGSESAYVLILSSKGNDEEEMSIGLLVGMHGFLTDPFSVDGVRNTAELAYEIKKSNIENRQKEGLQQCLGPASQLIDRIATRMRIDSNFHFDEEEKERISELIRSSEEENSELYYRVLIGSFIRFCRAEQKIGESTYNGTSERVRKRAAKRLLETDGA